MGNADQNLEQNQSLYLSNVQSPLSNGDFG